MSKLGYIKNLGIEGPGGAPPSGDVDKCPFTDCGHKIINAERSNLSIQDIRAIDRYEAANSMAAMWAVVTMLCDECNRQYFGIMNANDALILKDSLDTAPDSPLYRWKEKAP